MNCKSKTGDNIELYSSKYDLWNSSTGIPWELENGKDNEDRIKKYKIYLVGSSQKRKRMNAIHYSKIK